MTAEGGKAFQVRRRGGFPPMGIVYFVNGCGENIRRDSNARILIAAKPCILSKQRYR